MDKNVTQTLPNGTSEVTICVPHEYPAMAYIIYGYIVPCIAVVTICSNCLAVLVFVATNRKSPTNIMLTVLAFSNIFSIGSISPMFLVVYGLRLETTILNCSFVVYHDAAYYVSSFFHCFSIWLTVLLGATRYIVVAFPFVGPRLCNRRNTVVIIIVLCVISFAVVILPNMWSKSYKILHMITPNYTDITDFCQCSYGQYDFNLNLLYIWMRNIFGTTVPCLILLVMTILLMFELRKNNLKIRELHLDENAAERREQKHMKRASRLILAITTCFLITELPYTIFFTWIIIEPHPYDSALNSEARFTSSIIFNLFAYIGCTANFFILILMSRYFRDKLRHFLCMKCLRNRKLTQNRSKSYSYSYSVRSSNFI